MCRNTRSYLASNGVKGATSNTAPAPMIQGSVGGYEQYAPLPMRTTRRMNAWQQSQSQSQEVEWEQPRLGTTRSTRRSNVNYAED